VHDVNRSQINHNVKRQLSKQQLQLYISKQIHLVGDNGEKEES